MLPADRPKPGRGVRRYRCPSSCCCETPKRIHGLSWSENFLDVCFYRLQQFASPALKKFISGQGAVLQHLFDTLPGSQKFYRNIMLFRHLVKATLYLFIDSLLFPTQGPGAWLEDGIIGFRTFPDKFY